MKKVVFFVVALLMAGAPHVFADGRVDLGIDVPMGFGVLMKESTFDTDSSDYFREHIIPFPEAGMYFTSDAGPFTFGIGARAFTFIIQSMVWPNAFAEVNLGPVVLQGQIGGGLFLMFGMYNAVETGTAFFPDLSAWFKLGETFRLGGGVIGVYLDEMSETSLPVVFYLGAKAAIKL